jgi:hypothetical protein
VDSQNNRVGIDTNTPGATLDVQATSSIGLNVNQTGTNNLLQLEYSSTPVVTVSNTGATIFQNQTNSPSAFIIKTLGGTSLLTANTSADTLTVLALTVNVSLTVDGHVITANSSGTTSATVESAAGSSSTCTLSTGGNDTGGQITIVTGTSGWAVGEQCRISFATSYTSAPHPVISNASSQPLTSVMPYVTTSLSGGANSSGYFSINFINADTAQHTYVLNYFNAQ